MDHREKAHSTHSSPCPKHIVFIGTQTFTALPIRFSSRSWIGWCRGRWWITRGRCWLKSFLCLL